MTDTYMDLQSPELPMADDAWSDTDTNENPAQSANQIVENEFNATWHFSLTNRPIFRPSCTTVDAASLPQAGGQTD